MSIPSFSGTARTYLGAFPDFEPKTLNEAGLLSEEGKALMASIPAANLAAETAAMKGGFTLEQQKGINETLLAVEEMKNERARKESILNQLGGGTFAGDALSKFLGGSSDPLSNLAVQAAAKTAYEQPPSLLQSGIGTQKVDTSALMQEIANDPVLLDSIKKFYQNR